MIRPSSLQLAERCGLSAKLQAEVPEESEAASRGTALHREIATWITSGVRPTLTEAVALADRWTPPPGAKAEAPVSVRDPEDDSVITEGTADLVYVSEAFMGQPATLVVVDWKSGLESFVTEPDDNLQLQAYAVGAAIERGLTAFQVVLGFLRTDGPDWRTSKVFPETTWWPLLDRIRKAAAREPVANRGEHCLRCWGRMRCPAWLLPAEPTARDLELAPLASTELAKPEAVLRLHLAAKALKELAERGDAYVKAYVAQNGALRGADGKELALVEVAGRRSVSVEDVIAAGRPDLVKQGTPSQQLRWRKAG